MTEPFPLPPREEVEQAAWRQVLRYFLHNGSRCSECEMFRSYDGSFFEEPSSTCLLLDVGGSPNDCPGVGWADIDARR